MATNNVINNENVPAFSYRTSAAANNETGDGTLYTILYDTMLYSNGGTVTAGVFTAPIAGIYSFTGKATITNITNQTFGWLKLVTSASDNYILCIQNMANIAQADAVTGIITFNGTVEVYMPVGSTARVQIGITGGAKTIIIEAGSVSTLDMTSFSGYLLSTSGTHLY
jgi:hypothetical protein